MFKIRKVQIHFFVYNLFQTVNEYPELKKLCKNHTHIYAQDIYFFFLLNIDRKLAKAVILT